MIDPGPSQVKYVSSKKTLKKLKNLKGYISEKAARTALIELLQIDTQMAVNLLFDLELFPTQIVLLKTMFNRSRFLCVLARGYGKSWTTALFAALYALWNPGVRIGILSAVFRSSREIIKKIEDFSSAKGAVLFKDCIGKITHATDYWSIQVGSSEIISIPAGERARGYRFQVVVVDEMLLIPNDTIKSVILPFLSTNQDPVRKRAIKEEEDKLIVAGVLKEEDRTQFPTSKFIGLSSASFKFEEFAKTFESYEQRILHPSPKEKEKEALSYALAQMSYESAPAGLYQEGFIEDAKAQMSDIYFKREMESQFVEGSGGFFNLEKMLEYSSKFGEEPFIEVIGDKRSEYILAIDPNRSDSDEGDYFAISVLKIDRKTQKTWLVHAFERAGDRQKNQIEYLAYLLLNFNVVYIIIDNAGWEFIDSCNNSQIFKDVKLTIDKFEYDYENENKSEGLRNTKKNYNKELGKIVHVQYFSNSFIDLANSMLQTSLNFGRVWFCGAPDDSGRDLLIKQARTLPIDKFDFGDLDEFDKEFQKEAKIMEFVDNVSFIVGRVREECSLIEVKISNVGTTTYDLPRALKLSKGKNRPRRDGYTSLLLANYAARCYFDLMDNSIQVDQYSNFIPEVIHTF